LTEHVCQACLGRLLASTDVDDDEPLKYECAQCGATCGPRQNGIIPICACALRVGSKPVMDCVRVPDDMRLQPGVPMFTARLRDAESAELMRMPRPVAEV
jgi:hypothetical protein